MPRFRGKVFEQVLGPGSPLSEAAPEFFGGLGHSNKGETRFP